MRNKLIILIMMGKEGPMDTNIDEKMYHQIEKNLSNNMNENLFTSGRIFDNDSKLLMGNSVFDNSASANEKEPSKEYDEEWHAQVTMPQTLSRAEYIRQAREACLRQMSAQSIVRNYDYYDVDTEEQSIDVPVRKKSRSLKSLYDMDTQTVENESAKPVMEENTPQEIAAFRSLIIRIICAFVLFLSVFAIDKFDIKAGKINPQIVEEYVTGNDTLQVLENIIVTWLK